MRTKAIVLSRSMLSYTFGTPAVNATCRLVVPPHRAVIVDLMTADGEMRQCEVASCLRARERKS